MYAVWAQKGERVSKIEISENKIPHVKSFLPLNVKLHSLVMENNYSSFHQFSLGWCFCVTAIQLLIHCDSKTTVDSIRWIQKLSMERRYNNNNIFITSSVDYTLPYHVFCVSQYLFKQNQWEYIKVIMLHYLYK